MSREAIDVMGMSAEDPPAGLAPGRVACAPGAARSSEVVPWQLLAAELVGTALLVAVGLSVVIVDFGQGSALTRVIPSAGERRALTGFLFGSVGALIALSGVGRVSGAHINPVVSLAFFCEGKLSSRLLAGYVLAQLVGATLGAGALLVWGGLGRSVEYGATVPGPRGPGIAVLGEAAATFFLIAGLFALLGAPRLRRFTPLLFPPLYALMVYLEAPLSGTSTNPARTLGPAVVSGDWRGFYVYLAGPIVGTFAALASRRLPLTRRLEVEVAKVYHFALDPYEVFHPALRSARAATGASSGGQPDPASGRQEDRASGRQEDPASGRQEDRASGRQEDRA